MENPMNKSCPRNQLFLQIINIGMGFVGISKQALKQVTVQLSSLSRNALSRRCATFFAGGPISN